MVQYRTKENINVTLCKPQFWYLHLHIVLKPGQYSEELSTKIARGLMICHVGWGRFTVGWRSAAGFWANTRFLLLGGCFAVLPALTSHYWYLHLPPAPSLTFWEGHTLGLYSFFLYVVPFVAKMNGKGSSRMFLCLETYSRLEISGDFYCYLFWQQPLNVKYKLEYKPAQEWQLTGDRTERTGVEIQIAYCL